MPHWSLNILSFTLHLFCIIKIHMATCARSTTQEYLYPNNEPDNLDLPFAWQLGMFLMGDILEMLVCCSVLMPSIGLRMRSNLSNWRSRCREMKAVVNVIGSACHKAEALFRWRVSFYFAVVSFSGSRFNNCSIRAYGQRPITIGRS